MLIINADDWGRNRTATDRSLQCHGEGRVTAASAMVFMEDSQRAAELARARGLDMGLHLNFTLPFTDDGRRERLKERQRRIAAYLLKHKYRLLFYNPALRNDFEYVYGMQVEEYARLYGRPPSRIDGHHHMHLCANMLYGRIIPAGTRVRRNFSFSPGEKSPLNRLYRAAVDARLRRRYHCTDYFFRLLPLSPGDRIGRIASLARRSTVELAVHPEAPVEFDFLMSQAFASLLAGVDRAGFASK
jgi:hypothetical protein